jgi:hypothetical protein
MRIRSQHGPNPERPTPPQPPPAPPNPKPWPPPASRLSEGLPGSEPGNHKLHVPALPVNETP